MSLTTRERWAYIRVEKRVTNFGGGLIFRGAHTWVGLFTEFYDILSRITGALKHFNAKLFVTTVIKNVKLLPICCHKEIHVSCCNGLQVKV